MRIHRCAGRWREELPTSPARFLLTPGWMVLRSLIGFRGLAYDQGLATVHRLPVPVISVGNLLAGGTGKTPAVKAICALLTSLGRQPAVLSRGYRGEGGANEEAALVGDVHVICDPDRVRGGRRALDLGANVLVLDDGFQHRRLHRDLDIVLLDATRPWGREDGAHGQTLPLGYLREPPSALTRAHLLWITRWDQANPARQQAILAEVQRIAPGVPVVHDRLEDAHLRPLAGGPPEDLATWRDRPVILASGIGHPAAFEQVAQDLGLKPIESWRFPDHHHFTPEQAAALALRPHPLVITGKDAVKLARLPHPPRAWVLETRHVLADPGPNELKQLIQRILPGT